MILNKEWYYAGSHSFNTIDFAHIKEIGHESPRLIVRQLAEEPSNDTQKLAQMLAVLPAFLALSKVLEAYLNVGGDPHLSTIAAAWSQGLDTLCQK